MTEDCPPDEALDACLYAMDLKLAALRSSLAELRMIELPNGVFVADALAEYVDWIERVIEHSVAVQAAVLRRS